MEHKKRGCVCVGAGKLKHPKEQTNIEITKKEKEKVQNVPRSVALVCYEPVKHYVRGLVVFFYYIAKAHTDLIYWSRSQMCWVKSDAGFATKQYPLSVV